MSQTNIPVENYFRYRSQISKVDLNTLETNINNSTEDKYYKTLDLDNNVETVSMDDIIILGKISDTSYYPIHACLDSDRNFRIADVEEYKDTEFFICSKRQFLYKRYIVSETSHQFKLDSDMKTAWNPNKFMIFRNNKLVNNNLLHFKIPAFDNKYKDKKIFSTMEFVKGDILDVFYIESDDNMDPVPINRDIHLVWKKYVAKQDNDMIIFIPYPNISFLRRKESFYVFNENGLYLDNRYDYTVSDDGYYISLAPFNKLLREGINYLIFVFPYMQSDMEEEYPDRLNTGERSTVVFKYQFSRNWVKANSSDSLFAEVTEAVRTDYTLSDNERKNVNLDEALVLDFKQYDGQVFDTWQLTKEHFIIFGNTTWIAPERYSILDNGRVIFYDPIDIDHIPYAKYTMAIFFEESRTNERHEELKLKVYPVKAAYDGQTMFNIPLEKGDYLQFILFIGSIIFERDKHYEIDATANTVKIINNWDKIKKGRSVYFIFTLPKNKRLNKLTKFMKQEFPVHSEMIEDAPDEVLNRLSNGGILEASNGKWNSWSAVANSLQIDMNNFSDKKEFLLRMAGIDVDGIDTQIIGKKSVDRAANGYIKEFLSTNSVSNISSAFVSGLTFIYNGGQTTDIASSVLSAANNVTSMANVALTGSGSQAQGYILVRYFIQQCIAYGVENVLNITPMPPDLYEDLEIEKKHFLLFLNGVYVKPTRFWIINNKIYLSKDFKIGYRTDIKDHYYTAIYLYDFYNPIATNPLPGYPADMLDDNDEIMFEEIYTYPKVYE